MSRTYTLLGKPAAASERVTAGAEYGMPVESGTRVRVDLEVKANKAVEFLLIEDLKAAGFKPWRRRAARSVCEYRCAHVELRTDRVAFFFSQIPVGVTKLSYELRAEAPGSTPCPPASRPCTLRSCAPPPTRCAWKSATSLSPPGRASPRSRRGCR